MPLTSPLPSPASASGAPSDSAVDLSSTRGGEQSASELHRPLLAWYAAHRRDLPWRDTRDPYAIWVSEVMLQQTRVATVRDYYNRFLLRFPTAKALASAPEDEVLSAWQGLGYYRRARLLHEGAKYVSRLRAMPETVAELRGVPGIGRYTAGAVASIAFHANVPVVDGNVERVFVRLFGLRTPASRARTDEIWARAERLVPAGQASAWNQALMELGATICTPKSPRCDDCPLAFACQAKREAIATRLETHARKPEPTCVREICLRVRDGSGRYLVCQRSSQLYRGMWEPPCIDVTEEQGEVSSRRVRAFARVLGLSGRIVRMGVVEHRLTHRAMTIEVFELETHSPWAPERPLPEELSCRYGALRWVTGPEDVPCSRLARKLLLPAIG